MNWPIRIVPFFVSGSGRLQGFGCRAAEPTAGRDPSRLGRAGDMSETPFPQVTMRCHTGQLPERVNQPDWTATWNDNPRPFTWTKTADEILNSPRRLLRQTRHSPPQ
jgi:hypothetical protein